MSIMRAVVRRGAMASAAPQWKQQAWTRRWASTEAEAEKKEQAEETKAEHEADHSGEGHLECPKEKKIHELTKNVAYALAEADNARKIAARDVDNARQFALKSFAKDLLDVVDNLDRAVSSVTPAQLESEPAVGVLHKGVSMTQHTLLKVLEKNGVEKQKLTIGDVFDPNLHEAIFMMPNSETSTPGSVGTIVKSGFNYKERVLRATQVGVFQED
eukprot:TRINITY_DN44510_c0_g1_i1.p2 TRINITY_DN44510_c0_g1~~TRINITY_DN44510_c0_g1_i1.p2  ORF type:complete len:215 (+),score=106.50 TRINITY_DN44510_c0_g1_i1:64-708(+)